MIERLDRLPENNPFTGRAYDDSWVVFLLTDSPDYRQMCGSSGGVYTIQTSRRQCPDWKMAAGDFAGFARANGKNAVLVMSEAERRAAEAAYRGRRYDEPLLRDDEPRVLIHSTPLDSWEKIRRDGALKSWNILRAEQALVEEQPIGARLGDPADFRDYVMFGGGVTGEIVVQSRQRGEIVMDGDAAYLTGARLYFDAGKIARDGLLLRDGCHLKVRDRLPLEPYLLWAATWETAGLAERLSTPARFAEACDRRFQSLFPQYPLG